MERLKELRMTLIILLVGVFFLSGCFFSSKKEITFKTNGGSVVKNVTVKKGNKISEPEKPTKAGYEFVGWYLDGEEYDFDKEVSEDITLIAKWVKVDDTDTDLDLNTTEPITEPTTEETTTSKTTNKNSSIKKTTIRKLKATTTKKTTTSTTTTKKASVETPVQPTTPIIPTPPTPELPTEPVKKEFKMNISSVDVPDELGVATGKKEVTIDFASATPNVTSLISEEELQEVLKSDYNEWIIHNEYAFIYNTDYIGERIGFLSDTEVKVLSVIIGEKRYIIEYNESTTTWEIKYPTIRVVDGVNTYYYNSLKQALEVVHPKAIITLLNDVELTESLKIKNAITLDGGEHILKMAGTPLIVEVLDALEDAVIIKNVKVEVENFVKITDKTKIKSLILENISGTYKDTFIENKDLVTVEEINNTVKKEEIVEDKEETPEEKKEDMPKEEVKEEQKTETTTTKMATTEATQE